MLFFSPLLLLLLLLLLIRSGIVSIFSWLHARSKLVLSGGGTPSVLVRHEGLWFHARETPGGGELYVLYAGHLAAEVIEATSEELLYTLERFAGEKRKEKKSLN